MIHELQKLKFFHNPNAENPISSALFPEATHWLSVNGEIICKRFFKQSILKSQTIIQPADDPVPNADSLSFQETYDADDKII
ncbi:MULTISPECIES: hypothetical protein [Klebsiella pneumoniae complex]|uniref:hypothetical protein n=1 Tax=Klebsiella pneumoniae complex TaxID=3390273 RepID=UPI00115F12D3|nr:MULTISPECIES: hypothetical protein [Klebsiella]HBR0931233.1 hypothetical protein [Klebsiella variicola]HBU5898268.1 hypothetical protein [Klebsiella variicola]HDS8534631.1 hypothetical protein [Klebsiella variicola]